MHPGDDLETKSDKLDEIKDVSNIFDGTSNDSDSGFRSETPDSPNSSDSGKDFIKLLFSNFATADGYLEVESLFGSRKKGSEKVID